MRGGSYEVKLGWLDGIVLIYRDLRLVFDPVGKRGITSDSKIFISHAHSDHTYGFSLNNQKYSTPETREIYERVRGRKVRNVQEVPIGTKIKFDDVEVEVLNSGHILGSAQFRVVTPEKVLLYTGDINCVDTLVTEAADWEPCDEAVMEATYGDPSYIFPERNLVYANMVKWATRKVKEGKIPAFRAYAVGKAQEIIKLFNLYTRVPVVSDLKVAKVNEAYLRARVPLNYGRSLRLGGKESPFIYVSSNPRASGRRFVKAVATGWALRAWGEEGAFPLSSHADFNQLMDYVERIKARKVHLFTGQSRIQSYLRRKLKVEAGPLPPLELSQRKLT